MTTQTDTATLAADMNAAFGMDTAWAVRAIAKMNAPAKAKLATEVAATLAEKDALRTRIMADAELRKVLAIRTDWMTAHDRYDVARRALDLIERTAKHEALVPSALVRELANADATIQAEIDRHGDDPRTTMWGKDFYGFRWRLADAVGALKVEDKRIATLAREAALYAQGREICTRCGGAGGSDRWPGFTCFDCGGAGDVRQGRRR